VDAASFASTCKTIRRQSFPVRYARFSVHMHQFLDTLINGRYQEVKNILERYPNLFMLIPPKMMVIENRHTWQKFYAKDALTMMVMLKEMKKIQLLLVCYARLDQTRKDVTDSKNQALAAWKPYVVEGVKDNETVVVPKEYADLAEKMIKVFLKETFPNGVPGADRNPNDPDAGIIPWDTQLSEQTEQALKFLLDRLVPEEAVKLKDHIDAELVLLAVYRAYVKFFESFKNQRGDYDFDKLDMICIRVMGLALTAVQRTSGENYCEGFDAVVAAMQRGEEKAISERAANLKLSSGEDFYRTGRLARQGQGFRFFCSIFGERGAGRRVALETRSRRLESFCQAKTTSFWKLRSNANEQLSCETSSPEVITSRGVRFSDTSQ
jgi:hypothetical protein